MDILIVIALALVACLLGWNIAQHRSKERETQLQQQSDDTVQALLELTGPGSGGSANRSPGAYREDGYRRGFGGCQDG